MCSFDLSSPTFWGHLHHLLKTHRLMLDRPKGSAHPRFPNFIYPVDYGFLEGTSGGDGEGIDVWAGSCDRTKLNALVCTVDLYKCDTEIKLLIGCTEAELQAIVSLHNTGPQAGVLLRNPEHCA